MARIEMYAVGVVHASVCAPKDMPKEEVVRQANEIEPTGVGPWIISSEPAFANGTENPTECDENPDNIHYLLDC